MHDPREVLSRPAPPPDATLSYGDDPDHVVDVRWPGGRRSEGRWGGSPVPLVIVVHGGFWRAEWDRTHTGPMAAALAAHGYVVAVPEYARTGSGSGSGVGGGSLPATFGDISAALRAIPELLAGEFSAPVGPVVWVGHSAGGHLVLWAAASTGSARSGVPVDRVVALAGCADLSLCSSLGLDDGATDLLMGGTPETVPQRYAAADPARLPPPRVPVTLLHGTADDRVPIEVSRSYVRSMSGAGSVVLRELPGIEHFGLIDPLSPAWPEVLAAIDGSDR